MRKFSSEVSGGPVRNHIAPLFLSLTTGVRECKRNPWALIDLSYIILIVFYVIIDYFGIFKTFFFKINILKHFKPKLNSY